MALLGSAAIALSFDIEPAATGEHDEWHSREHMPERLSIPGFHRGSRWRSDAGSPRYFVLYEVTDPAVLNSAAYLRRLDQPTPWTTKMMASYRGMARSLCRVVASHGTGLGGSVLVVRVTAVQGRDDKLRQRLAGDVLPGLAARRSIVAAHLLESVEPAAVTVEQRIRGRDADLRFTLVALGYDDAEIRALVAAEFLPPRLHALGAADAPLISGAYRLAAALTTGDLRAG